MSLEVFEDLLDQMPTVCEVYTAGLSEILMTPQAELLGMLQAVRRRAIWTQLVTNGSLLHQRDWIPKIAESDLNEICVSVDGATRAVFESVRRGSNFERVVSNLRLLVRKMTSVGLENRVKVQMTVQNANVSEMGAVLDLVEQLGVRSIHYCVDIFDWGSPTWRARNRESAVSHRTEDLAALAETGRKKGLYVGFIRTTDKFRLGGPNAARCRWPFAAVMISSDSRVVPCCHISNPDFFEIPTDRCERLDVLKVWNSGPYREFRQSHREGNPPDVCRSCYQPDPLVQSLDLRRRESVKVTK